MMTEHGPMFDSIRNLRLDTYTNFFTETSEAFGNYEHETLGTGHQKSFHGGF